jgi:hypothetical protein
MIKFELGQSINLDGVKATMDKVPFSPLNSTSVFSIDKRDLPEEHKDIKALRTVQYWKVLDEQGNGFAFNASAPKASLIFDLSHQSLPFVAGHRRRSCIKP